MNFGDPITGPDGWAVVVAQLVERLLPIPEVPGSNPVIVKNLSEQNGVSERSELTPFLER